MRARTLAGVVLIVVAGAVTMAQPPPVPPPPPPVDPGITSVPVPNRPAPPPVVDYPELAPVPPVDPTQAVEAFLARNRKEADDAIKSLTKEADSLRARLQKVEWALSRWQAVSEALKQDQTRPTAKEAPVLKTSWRKDRSAPSGGSVRRRVP